VVTFQHGIFNEQIFNRIFFHLNGDLEYIRIEELGTAGKCDKE